MNMPSFITNFMVAHKTLAIMLGMNYRLLQTGIPMIIPSSGSMADNGAITLTTALDTTYANCYLYLPANAISAGSAAGLYYAVMSSTTAGTVYNNTYTSGKPAIPASPTAFVTTGPGAYTQTTGSDITLLSFTLPGGSLGASGSMVAYYHGLILSSVGTKNFKLSVGGTIFGNFAATTSGQALNPFTFRNKGAVDKNVGNGAVGFSSGAASPSHGTVNTASDQTVLMIGRLATATDYVGYLGVSAEIRPAA